MISPLPSALVPYLGVGELPSSFASRIGHLLGRSARDLCLDVGLKFQAIVDGDPEMLNRLASLGRVEPNTLMRFSFQRAGRQAATHPGQIFPIQALSWSTIRVCPACIAMDLSDCSLPIHVRPFRRTSWLVRDIQTCHIHEQALLEISSLPGSHGRHDFSAQIALQIPAICDHAREMGSRKPTCFEAYAFSRLCEDDQISENWLDQFSIDGAGKICLLFGAMEAFGEKATIGTLGDNDRRTSQRLGFQIASSGEAAIRRWLMEVYKRRGTTKRTVGPKTHFSCLYAWLAYGPKNPQYELLRKIVADYCFDTLPDRRQVLGYQQTNPKVLSVHTAALKYQIHPKKLRKLLRLMDILDEGSDNLSDDHAAFDASKGHIVIDRFARSLTSPQAAERLNIHRPLSEKLLGGKYLPPLVQNRPGYVLKPVFEEDTIKKFLRGLLIDASPIIEADSGLLKISEASRRACCGTMEIIDLIMSRQLRTVRISDTDRGIQSIRIDLEEVLSHVRRADHGGLSLREVEEQIGTSTAVVKALVQHGILQSRNATNPVNRCPQTVVDRESVADFRSEFISLVCLAEERGIPFRRLKKQLSNIPAAFDRNEIGATFFRRSSLQD